MVHVQVKPLKKNNNSETLNPASVTQSAFKHTLVSLSASQSVNSIFLQQFAALNKSSAHKKQERSFFQ